MPIKKIPILVKKQPGDCMLVAVNNYIVYGQFPHLGVTVAERNISLMNLAMAFSVSELEEMLAYRKGEKKPE